MTLPLPPAVSAAFARVREEGFTWLGGSEDGSAPPALVSPGQEAHEPQRGLHWARSLVAEALQCVEDVRLELRDGGASRGQVAVVASAGHVHATAGRALELATTVAGGQAVEAQPAPVLAEDQRLLRERLKLLGWRLDGWSPALQAWEASRVCGAVRPFLKAGTASELVLLCATFNTLVLDGGRR